MEYVTLADARVPAIGLGTWQLTGSDCRRAVPAALELGYRHVDTAQMYGNESDIGSAVHQSGVERDALWLTTKVNNGNHAPDEVRRTTEDSLRALRTEYVDLLLVHWPVEWDRMGATLAALTALRDGGKARHIGVSNFTAPQLVWALGEAPVACIQAEYHPYLAQRALLDVARRHDLLFAAYSPLGRGEATGDEVIAGIAAAHDASPAQVTLRWLIDQDRVAAIPKATSREHLTANLDVFDLKLTDDERKRIAGRDRSQRIVDPPFAPDWDAVQL